MHFIHYTLNGHDYPIECAANVASVQNILNADWETIEVHNPHTGPIATFTNQCTRTPLFKFIVAVELFDDEPPAAACRKCGGWTAHGGMSQHAYSDKPVQGRIGCVCFRR